MKIMKRMTGVLLIVVLLLLTACQPAVQQPTVCQHTNVNETTVAATCTEEGSVTKTCAKCGVFLGKEVLSSLGHTTITGTCSRCGETFDKWSLSYYVDNFGQDTNEAYVSNDTPIFGTFSNSATTDSLLRVDFLVDDDNVCVFLYEYGTLSVQNSGYYDDYYNITMRVGNKDTEMRGSIYSGSDRIVINASYRNTIINALKGNTDIMFYIVDEERTTTKYLFTVKPTNFKEVYAKL